MSSSLFINPVQKDGYFAHVDGLRAVAVLMVVLFHYGFGFPGGYAGVDVFFVLSGFLITRILLNDLKSGDFRAATFWCRRARRILPALMVVLATTALAGWFLLLPADFESLGRSLLAQAAFLQNVVFWRGEGYFALPSESKPLLHTWSLAVEEQFYLFYPLLLWGLFRFHADRRLVSVLGGILVFSFVLGVVGSRLFPSAAFYFLPTRAWELLAGAMVVLAPPFSGSNRLREVLSATCLGGIIASGWLFSAETPFPGFAASLPVLATGGLVWLNLQSASLTARLLSARPIVFIGLISYSLYLWHWPILVFAKLWAPGPLGEIPRIFLALFTFLLAALTWRLVEQPVRLGAWFRPPSRVAAISAVSLLSCAAVGLFITSGDGLAYRMPHSVLACTEASEERYFIGEHKPDDIRSGNLTSFGSSGAVPRIFVWGDSLAMALLAGMDEMLRERGEAGVAATHSATPPLLDFDFQGVYSLGDQSGEFANEVVEFVRRESFNDVFLVAAWSGYLKKPAIRKSCVWPSNAQWES